MKIVQMSCFFVPLHISFRTFRRPLTYFIVWWEVTVGGDELKWRQLPHSQLMSPQGPRFSLHSTAKTKDKNTNLRKNGICWYSETCVNDHLYQVTTYLGVPAAPHSKLCSETLPKANICLMRTTTTFYTPLVEK